MLNSGEKCPRCGATLENVRVPCPDEDARSRAQCLVMHYGVRCTVCDYPRSDTRPSVPIGMVDP